MTVMWMLYLGLPIIAVLTILTVVLLRRRAKAKKKQQEALNAKRACEDAVCAVDMCMPF